MNPIFTLSSFASIVTSSEIHPTWEFSFSDAMFGVGVILSLVLLNGFFVAAEFAISTVRDSQLQDSIDEGVGGAKFARKVTKHLDAYLSAAQLGITLASVGLGMVSEPYIARIIEPLLQQIGLTNASLLGNISLAVTFAVIAFLHVVIGELTPKSIAIRRSLPVALIIARPLHFFYCLFKPIIYVLNGTANGVVKKVFGIDPSSEGERVHSEEELKHLVSESERSEEVTETEKKIVLNALALNDRYVRDLMTPRKDVVCLDVNLSFEENLKIALESKHTRFPLVQDSHLDRTLGLIHTKDLLRLVQEGGKSCDLLSIKRNLLLVPEMMSIDVLLKFFLEKHAHFALAIDEYGGGVGIVTLDNVFEEIVGDIQDEFDTAEKPKFRRINDDEFEVEGMLNLYDLNEFTDLDLESDEVTTVGGYVTHVLGHFPKLGETVEIEHYQATTTRVEARRVGQLHFKRLEESVGAEEKASAI